MEKWSTPAGGSSCHHSDAGGNNESYIRPRRCKRFRTPIRDFTGQVTFEPGARTAWHTHPLGQTLVVTAGLGWAQREGGPIEEIRAGDVVWFPPGLKHWHGATPTTAMTHVAIQESVDGKNVDWMEKVADDQYRK